MTIIEHYQIDGGYYRLNEKLLHYSDFEKYANTATKITYKNDEVILEFDRYSPKVKNIKIDEVLYKTMELFTYSNIFSNILEAHYQKENPNKSLYILDTSYNNLDFKIKLFYEYLESNGLFLYWQDEYVFVGKKNDLSENNIIELGEYFNKNTLEIALSLRYEAEIYPKV